MKKLSAVVPVKNTENLIDDCLKSIGWVNEIIVVDDSSTDKTVEKAKKYKNVEVVEGWGSFSDRRNQGIKKSNCDWFLIVDADERVPKSLRDEISQLINKSTSQYSAFAIPRRNFILGKELKHGGWWPDYAKRLFKRDKFKKWTGELHEEPVFKGKLGHLKNPLIHLKHDNLSDMVDKTNEWSEIEAKLMYKAKHPPMNILRFATAMFREFWLRMVKQRAFMDGSTGIIYALYQVFSRFVSYAKLWELQIQKNG
ncbi:glycosyltransferase family 2 protein [Patescibacteria group bacterium]|nr:glycosyltransferase family 2 protein [Patescibacteria group bacterium]